MKRSWAKVWQDATASETIAFALMVALLCAAFLLGGSSRADVASLLVLRPLSAFALALGLAQLRSEHFRANRGLLILGALIVALPGVQLIPLPPSIWTSLPGRDLIVEIDAATGLGSVWRPLSMTPFETQNALFALMTPAALLVLGVQLSQQHLRRLVWIVLALGFVSACLGLIQLLDGADSSFRFYTITNTDGAVGLFANRNHQALLLATLFPVLGIAAQAGQPHALRAWVCTLAGLTLVPLVLITGSRAGLLLTLFAIVLIPLVLGTVRLEGIGGRFAKMTQAGRLAVAGLGLGLAGLTVSVGRAVAWERLFTEGPEADMRWRILPVIWTMLRKYNWAGSGMGSFERVYQIDEPDELLATFYMNHAHNDWLELLLSGGMLGALVLFAAIIAWSWRAIQVLTPNAMHDKALQLPRLGLASLLLVAVASLVDYPLRTPALASFLVIAALWARQPESEGQSFGLAQHSVSR